MARPTPSMEMFLVGAYLQLVEGCDSVTYTSELPNPKEFWLEVVGRSEARQCVFYVDFPEKFDWYPAAMRPDTMVKKLVKRYVEVVKEGLALEYAPECIRCQLWMPRPPSPRVGEALPKVKERLRERHGIELDLIGHEEMAQRVPVVVERVLKQTFDYDNLFIRALLLAQGRLDYQAGGPMGQEQIEAMYRFPLALRSANDVPVFIYRFLSSEELVRWLDFCSPTFDDMANWLQEVGPIGALGELQQALAERGEVVDDGEDYGPGEAAYHTRRYSARDLAELSRLVLVHIDALWSESSRQSLYGPPHIEIDFMLPFLSRIQDRIDPSQIEREILRYGGSRDQMIAHFANEAPDKRPYRAILRVEFFRRTGERSPVYPGGKCMDVAIGDPRLTDEIAVALTINYAEDFTGYFVLMMSRLASGLGA